MSTALEPVTLPNGWSHRISHIPVELPEEAARQGVEIVNRWAKIYPAGDTWVSKTYGVPTLFARFDATYTNGRWNIIEIEDRPCGMGSTGRYNAQFKTKLTSLRAKWPRLAWVGAENRASDDDLWLGPKLSIAEALVSTKLILVRARPEDAAYHPLRVLSVSTVHEEGNKRPLVDLGYGTVVRWVDEGGSGELEGYIDSLPSGPCVVKPLRGTRGRQVMIHGVGKQDAPSKRSGDSRGIDAVERLVKSNRTMLCQHFIRPLELPHLPGMNAMYRFFFGYDPDEESYVPLGGAYVADQSLMLHGTETTVFGPLIVS